MIMTQAPPVIARSGLLIQCAWCLAIQISGVYHRCPIIPILNSPTDNVSHGICGECRANLATDMGRMLD